MFLLAAENAKYVVSMIFQYLKASIAGGCVLSNRFSPRKESEGCALPLQNRKNQL